MMNADMTVREETRVPSAEELERMLGANDPPEICHTRDSRRPGYRLCGQRTKASKGHDGGTLEEQLRTGYCACENRMCPECLRIKALRRLTGA